MAKTINKSGNIKLTGDDANEFVKTLKGETEAKIEVFPTTIEFNVVRHFIEMVNVIRQGHYTVPEIASRIHISERSTYRLLKFLEEIGIEVDKDFENRYFIVNVCPCILCGRKEVNNG